MKELQEKAIAALKAALDEKCLDSGYLDALTRIIDRTADIIYRNEGK